MRRVKYYSDQEVTRIAFLLMALGFAAGFIVSCSAASANTPSACDRKLVLCQLDLAVCTAGGESRSPKKR